MQGCAHHVKPYTRVWNQISHILKRGPNDSSSDRVGRTAKMIEVGMALRSATAALDREAKHVNTATPSD